MSGTPAGPWLAGGAAVGGSLLKYHLDRKSAARESDIIQKQAAQQALAARVSAQMLNTAAVIQMNQDFEALSKALATDRAVAAIGGSGLEAGGLASGSAMGVADERLRDMAVLQADRAYNARVEALGIETQASMDELAAGFRAAQVKKQPFANLIGDLASMARHRAMQGPTINSRGGAPVINKNRPAQLWPRPTVSSTAGLTGRVTNMNYPNLSGVSISPWSRARRAPSLLLR